MTVEAEKAVMPLQAKDTRSTRSQKRWEGPSPGALRESTTLPTP